MALWKGKVIKKVKNKYINGIWLSEINGECFLLISPHKLYNKTRDNFLDISQAAVLEALKAAKGLDGKI